MKNIFRSQVTTFLCALLLSEYSFAQSCQSTRSSEMNQSIVDIIQQQLPTHIQKLVHIEINASQNLPDIMAVPHLINSKLQPRIAIEFETMTCDLTNPLLKKPSLTGWFFLTINMKGWMYKKNYNRHKIITKEDIEEKDIDVFLNGLKPEQISLQPINYWLIRSVNEGKIVLNSDLSLPIPVIENQRVIVYLFENGLRMRTYAKSLSSGKLQDFVSLELTNPTRIIKGRVIDTGVVQIEF